MLSFSEIKGTAVDIRHSLTRTITALTHAPTYLPTWLAAWLPD